MLSTLEIGGKFGVFTAKNVKFLVFWRKKMTNFCHLNPKKKYFYMIISWKNCNFDGQKCQIFGILTVILPEKNIWTWLLQKMSASFSDFEIFESKFVIFFSINLYKNGWISLLFTKFRAESTHLKRLEMNEKRGP